MKETRVPIAIGMPRSFKSLRVLSSGVSIENFVITSQASQSHVTFERSYGAGSERGVVRPPQCGGRRSIRSPYSTRKQAEVRLLALGVALPSRLLPPSTAPPQLSLAV